jgi:hypothetical protein
MEFSLSIGMSFKTRLQGNSPKAGIRCSATHSLNKIRTERYSTILSLPSFYGQPGKLAIEAHGGLERWRQFNVVRANASITGALWRLKGQPDVLKNVRVVAQLHRQHLVTHLIAKDRRTIFATGQVSIESESGAVEETRVNPAASFRGQSLDTPWDMLHVAYFASYALWLQNSIHGCAQG